MSEEDLFNLKRQVEGKILPNSSAVIESFPNEYARLGLHDHSKMIIRIILFRTEIMFIDYDYSLIFRDKIF